MPPYIGRRGHESSVARKGRAGASPRTPGVFVHRRRRPVRSGAAARAAGPSSPRRSRARRCGPSSGTRGSRSASAPVRISRLDMWFSGARAAWPDGKSRRAGRAARGAPAHPPPPAPPARRPAQPSDWSVSAAWAASARGVGADQEGLIAARSRPAARPAAALKRVRARERSAPCVFSALASGLVLPGKRRDRGDRASIDARTGWRRRASAARAPRAGFWRSVQARSFTPSLSWNTGSQTSHSTSIPRR